MRFFGPMGLFLTRSSADSPKCLIRLNFLEPAWHARIGGQQTHEEPRMQELTEAFMLGSHEGWTPPIVALRLPGQRPGRSLAQKRAAQPTLQKTNQN